MINISTGSYFDRATRQIGSLRTQAEDIERQINTEQRLARSSDDPVAAARLRTLSRNTALSEMDQRNSDSAQTNLKMTDSALDSVANIIMRAKELATLAASGTYNDEQRAAAGAEIASLQESLLALANSRDASGHALFGGQTTGNAYENVGGTITYIGSATIDPVSLGEGQSVLPTLTGPDALSFEANGAQTDLFAVLGSLALALQSGNDPVSASQDALSTLDIGLEKVTTSQTVVGARLNWVDLMDQRREVMGELTSEEQKNVGGADLATSMMRLQDIMTVLEASQASFVKLSGLSLFNLIR